MTGSHFVGVAGFEPATSCSQSRHTNRTVLYPVLKSGAKIDLLFAFAKKNIVLRFMRSKILADNNKTSIFAA